MRCSLSVHLYGEGGVLSLTCIPRPSPDKLHTEREYNGPDKRPDRAPEGSTVVSIDRKKDMYSGGDMLSL